MCGYEIEKLMITVSNKTKVICLKNQIYKILNYNIC